MTKFIALFESLGGSKDRWPFAVPLYLALGIGLYFVLPFEPGWYWGPAVLAALGAVAALGTGAARIALVFAALICVGFTAGSVRTHSLDGGTLRAETRTTTIEGRIIDVQPFDKGSRIVLDRLKITGLDAHQTPATARLRLRGSQPPLRAGDWVKVRGRLSPPSPPVIPGGFDFQRHAYFNGIGAVGFSLGPAVKLAGPAPGPLQWRIHLSNLRLALAERVRNAIGGDAGTVAAALLTGHRTVIAEPVLEDFRRAGLAHLLAISGLHIGLAAGIMFFGVRGIFAFFPALAMRLPVKKLAAALALVVAGGYCLLAGATVPTQRAFFIAGLILVAVLADRRGLSLRLLAWGAAVILLFQPESLLGPSFQMSFAAAISLVAAYEYLWERRSGRPAWRDRPFAGIAAYAGGVAFTTVIASLATAPFVVHHFNEVAKFGLLANMVAVPVTALWVMPAAMFSFLLMPFDLDWIAFWLVGAGIDVVLAVAHWVSTLPSSGAVFPAAPDWALAVLALSGLWICLIRGPARAAGVLGIAVWAASVSMAKPPDIIVSGDGRLAAVLAEGEGYRFSNLRAGRFAREGWLAEGGFHAAAATKLPRDGAADGGLRCDAEGCILERHGRRAALAETYQAVAEDCHGVDVMVALVPESGLCPKGVIAVDRFDLARGGAHAVWLGPDIKVRAVNAGRGARPWVVGP